MIPRLSINWVADMFILILARHLLRTSPEGTWWYDDSLTWVAGFVALAWVVWFLVRRYLRARALRRRPRALNRRLLRRTVSIKRELSSQYLRPGFSANIHAVGIGILPGGSYYVQVFINDATDELWPGAGIAALPNSYRGVPVAAVEMARSVFMADDLSSPQVWNKYLRGIREPQEVIIGGISGANKKLTGQSGTIGYFCIRKSTLPRRKEIHLLSNSHVFADLRQANVNEGDLIMQPSPGEPASNRPIAKLVKFSPLIFDGDTRAPNHVDAAVARLWTPCPYQPLIPLIGKVKGYTAAKDIEPGEPVRKFGRTTGYTEGQVFSICLDIWIRYDRTGHSAFFHDQVLIEPTLPEFNRFVSGGDSGSLLVDAEQNAVGLIFAGAPKVPESLRASPNPATVAENPPSADGPKKIEGYGVANPISEVLDRLKIELVI
jgi:hypothetical protein